MPTGDARVPVHNLPISYGFMVGKVPDGSPPLAVLRLDTGTGSHHTFWTPDELIEMCEKGIRHANDMKAVAGSLIVPVRRPPHG